jgi:hypothetical protein
MTRTVGMMMGKRQPDNDQHDEEEGDGLTRTGNSDEEAEVARR